MKISGTAWEKYLDGLRKLDESAYENARERLEGYDLNNLSPGARKAVIDWMYELVGIYGGGSSELACQMYDAIAEASGQILPPAEPAPLPDYAEVAKTVNGTLKTGSPDEVAKGVSRLVKRTGVDTTMQNAIRDGAEWAWVPHGDTCAFCITLASRGWQKASKKALKNGHAEHIHSNCDCTYAVRFDGKSSVEGYDPQVYEDMYYGAESDTPEERINSLRREHYAEHREEINAQKREAYARRKDNSNEFDVDSKAVRIGTPSLVNSASREGPQNVRFKFQMDDEDFLDSVWNTANDTNITATDVYYVRNNIHQISSKKNIGKIVTLSSMDYIYVIEMKDFLEYNILWKIPNDDNINDALARKRRRR